METARERNNQLNENSMKLFLHLSFWLLLFTSGLLSLLGVPSFVTKPLIPLIPFILFLLTVYENNGRLKMPAIIFVILFIIISFLSGIINGIDKFSLFYFILYLIYPLFYFYAVINDDNLNIRFILKFVIILLLVQIPASIIKYFAMGIGEGGPLGTISASSGSTGAIFPLLVISFLLPLFYKTLNKKYLILIGLFCFIGVIGEKRVLFIMVPLLIVYSLIFYKKYSGLTAKNFKALMLTFAAGAAFFYGIVVLNPTLNPEREAGGSFDPVYLYNYTANYLFPEGRTFRNMSRPAGIAYFTAYTLKSPKNILIGDGAGQLTESRYTPGDADVLDHYGVRYGGRMGYVWIILQIGFAGLLLYLAIFAKIFMKIRKKFKSQKKNILYLAVLNLLFILIFDFFTYSIISIGFEFVYSFYFSAFALAYKFQGNFSNLKYI